MNMFLVDLMHTKLVLKKTLLCYQGLWAALIPSWVQWLPGVLMSHCITSSLQFCQLHIHAASLPFCYIPKVFYWIHIWWLGRSAKFTELGTSQRRLWICDMEHYPADSNLQRMVNWGMHVVSNNSCMCTEQMYLNHGWVVLKGQCQGNLHHTITPPPAAWTVDTRLDGSMSSYCWLQIVTLPSQQRKTEIDYRYCINPKGNVA